MPKSGRIEHPKAGREYDKKRTEEVKAYEARHAAEQKARSEVIGGFAKGDKVTLKFDTSMKGEVDGFETKRQLVLVKIGKRVQSYHPNALIKGHVETE